MACRQEKRRSRADGQAGGEKKKAAEGETDVSVGMLVTCSLFFLFVGQPPEAEKYERERAQSIGKLDVEEPMKGLG